MKLERSEYLEDMDYEPFGEDYLIQVPKLIDKYLSKYYLNDKLDIVYLAESTTCGYEFKYFEKHKEEFKKISKVDMEDIEIIYIYFYLKNYENGTDILTFIFKLTGNKLRLKIYESEYYFNDLKSLFQHIENEFINHYRNNKYFNEYQKTLKLINF